MGGQDWNKTLSSVWYITELVVKKNHRWETNHFIHSPYGHPILLFQPWFIIYGWVSHPLHLPEYILFLPIIPLSTRLVSLFGVLYKINLDSYDLSVVSYNVNCGNKEPTLYDAYKVLLADIILFLILLISALWMIWKRLLICNVWYLHDVEEKAELRYLFEIIVKIKKRVDLSAVQDDGGGGGNFQRRWRLGW